MTTHEEGDYMIEVRQTGLYFDVTIYHKRITNNRRKFTVKADPEGLTISSTQELSVFPVGPREIEVC